MIANTYEAARVSLMKGEGSNFYHEEITKLTFRALVVRPDKRVNLTNPLQV